VDETRRASIQGFPFLAAVQDVYSRRIIAWSMRDDLQTELVSDARGMAITARGCETAGVIAHSDHGSQYTSLRYGRYPKRSQIDLSMGSVGDRVRKARAIGLLEAAVERDWLHRP
jgi:putative transposase